MEIVELKKDVDFIAGKIEFNKEKYLVQLKEMTERYSGVELVEKDVPAAKKEVANLRKLIKSIDDKRKEVKAAYNTPLKRFEDDVKELTGEINKSVAIFTEQLEVFENKRKEVKAARVNEMIEKIKAEYGVQFDIDFDSSWLNASKNLGSIKVEVEKIIKDKQNELELIAIKKAALENKRTSLDCFLHSLQEKYNLENKIRFTEIEYLIELENQDMLESLEEIFKQRKENEEEFNKRKNAEKAPEAKTELTITFKLTDKEKEKLRKFIIDNCIEFVVV